MCVIQEHKSRTDADAFAQSLGIASKRMTEDANFSARGRACTAHVTAAPDPVLWSGTSHQNHPTSWVPRLTPLQRLRLLEMEEQLERDGVSDSTSHPYWENQGVAVRESNNATLPRHPTAYRPDTELVVVIGSPDGKAKWPYYTAEVRVSNGPTRRWDSHVDPSLASWRKPTERGVAVLYKALKEVPSEIQPTAVRPPNQATYNALEVHAPKWIRGGGGKRPRPQYAPLAMRLYAELMDAEISVRPVRPTVMD